MVGDADLVARCLKGERRAYDDLVLRYQSANGSRVKKGRVQGVRGNVLCLNSTFKAISEVEGDVFLLHAHAEEVSNLKGNLTQFDHTHPGSGRKDARQNARSTRIVNVSDAMDLDVSFINLDISGAEGNVTIRNRTGNTSIRAHCQTQGNRWRVHSVSGDIALVLDKAVVKDHSIAGATLSGTLQYKVIHDVIERFIQANDTRMRYFSTVYFTGGKGSRDHYRDADIFLSSESGNIEVKNFDC